MALEGKLWFLNKKQIARWRTRGKQMKVKIVWWDPKRQVRGQPQPTLIGDGGKVAGCPPTILTVVYVLASVRHISATLSCLQCSNYNYCLIFDIANYKPRHLPEQLSPPSNECWQVEAFLLPPCWLLRCVPHFFPAFLFFFVVDSFLVDGGSSPWNLGYVSFHCLSTCALDLAAKAI